MEYDVLVKKALSIQEDSKLKMGKDVKDYAFTFIYPPSQLLYEIKGSTIKKSQVERAGLYIHIPYCTGKCTYCYFGCYQLGKAPVFKKNYVEYLIQELWLIQKRYGRTIIESIHFGGGTPTTLNIEEFNLIFARLNEIFDLEEGIEITCESSPETLTAEKISGLKNLGVNRMNIGVQTLNDSILKSINRRHDADKALEAIRLVQESGIENINIDIMYGLEGQSFYDLEYTLEQIMNLNVQSISTYRLRIHPNGKLIGQIGQFDEEKMIKMYIKILEIMEKNQYYQCSSHKFARKEEFAQKQIITKRGVKKNNLIAVGMAAYGYIGNVLYWNARDIIEYSDMVASGKLPYSIGYELDEREEMAKVCVLGIHNVRGIDKDKFKQRFGVSVESIYGDLIDKLKQYELIETKDNYLQPSKLGMVFADEIATEFYSEYTKDKLKESKKRYGIFFETILN